MLSAVTSLKSPAMVADVFSFPSGVAKNMLAPFLAKYYKREVLRCSKQTLRDELVDGGQSDDQRQTVQ